MTDPEVPTSVDTTAVSGATTLIYQTSVNDAPNVGDDLTAEARRLLDAAMSGPLAYDEGMVCTLDGDIIGPCDCQRRPR